MFTNMLFQIAEVGMNKDGYLYLFMTLVSTSCFISSLDITMMVYMFNLFICLLIA